MTSNIGSHIIQEKFAEDEGWNHALIVEEAKKEVLDLLKASVRPEFLNRIDEIVLFEPLSMKNIRKIVDIQFKGIQKMLMEQGVTLDSTDEALTKLGEDGFDPAFGARPLKRVLQRKILNELSKGILSGQVAKDSVIMMELNSDGDLIFENVGSVEI